MRKLLSLLFLLPAIAWGQTYPSPKFNQVLDQNGNNLIWIPNSDSTVVGIGNGAAANFVATKPGNSIFIGNFSGNGVTTCTTLGFDEALGIGTLQFDQGCENGAFGSNALHSNTTGTFNFAFGNDSLANNTTGSGNIGIGHATCGGEVGAAVTGGGNICAGDQSGGYLSSTANSNAFFGANSGIGAAANLNTGNQNSAFGWGSMQFVGSGGQNSAFGFATMQGINGTPLTGSFNSAFGTQSG